MSIVTKLLITTLMTTPAATTEVRDLCDIVHRKTGVPTICKVHKEGAPIYDANVCCADGTCFPASTRGCGNNQELYYCGLGAKTSTGEVACYFEVPNYCDVFICETGVTPGPQENDICCSQGICWGHSIGSNDCEIGDLYWCSSVVSNADGTVSCVDWE